MKQNSLTKYLSSSRLESQENSVSVVNCLRFYLLKLSVVKEEVGSVEVSKGISRVETDSGLVVLHGTRFIPHELLDQTSVCEELFCERVTLKM